MKKILATLLCICAAIGLKAEGPGRHSISLSSGFLTAYDIINMIGDVNYPPPDISLGGTYVLGYDFAVSPMFSVGIAAGFALTSVNSYETSHVWRHYRYFHVMPRLSYRWIRKERFAMYSSAAFGIDFAKEYDRHSVEPAFQITIISAEYFFGKSRHFGIFAELGAGFQGILNTGLRLKL